MTELQLIEKHSEILNYLLKYREKDTSFIFSPRKQHNDLENNHQNCRLCKGYWFQGANNYIFVPLYRRGCKANKTKTIGYVLENNSQYIEIVYKQLDSISGEEYKFYDELVSFLKKSPQIKEVEKKRERQYFCYLVTDNMKENLDFFIKVFRRKADELILKYKLEDKYFISEDTFNAQLEEIRKIKKDQLIVTIEDFERRYFKFVRSLPLYGNINYAKLYTKAQNKPFKVYKNSQNSIVVYAFTENATPMVITLNQLKKVFFEKENYLYASYEQVLIDRILDEKLIENGELIEDIEIKNTQNSMKIKNIILYGSPGVGKTHNVNKLISMIEEGKKHRDIFDSIQKNINEKVNLDPNLSKRVKFITFHQSFGYEDFIEGFRPNKLGKIELEDGVLKKFLKDSNKLNQEKSYDFKNIDVKSFLDYYREYAENNIVDTGFDVISKGYFVADNIIIEPPITNYFGIYNEDYTGGRSSSMDFLTLEQLLLNKIFSENDIYKFLSKDKQDEKINIAEDVPVEKHSFIIKSVKREREEELFLKAFYTSKIIEDMLNKLDSYVKKHKKNIYLVIDEINRGNISKIFGEIITLIEESKRDIFEVQLPYSKKTFIVPSNLYIIGTMNSTDKSIALIDIALRRRFTFLKMEPNPELVPEFAREIFQRVNEQIINDLGSDYQLGHSYFMNINKDELELVLKYKIEPLLEEYYYGNSDGLENVLKILFPNI